jgi:ankyrin repeat protein
MIQTYVKNSEEFGKDWKIILQKLPAERLSEFGILVKDFYTAVPSRFEENWRPMHIAADHGHLDFCKFIAKISVTKSFRCPPLLLSVQAGHLEVSKYLYSEIDNKTPKTGPSQISPQHLAAKNGHLEIFRFLHENLHDLNPPMQELMTPIFSKFFRILNIGLNHSCSLKFSRFLVFNNCAHYSTGFLECDQTFVIN